MQPEQLGSFRLTSLSFSRIVIRKMIKNHWDIKRYIFELNDEGYGKAVYRINTNKGVFHFIVFSHKINEQDRADQASSTKWDTTFTICEGEVTKQKLYWLQSELPKQKLGRGDSSCLVWSRANKSQRIFEYIVEELSKGYQPDIDFIAEVGYILRTTAVFGNGKCGINPLENIKENHAFSGAFHAELFSVYMIRQFSFDLVEHIAKRRNTEAASLS